MKTSLTKDNIEFLLESLKYTKLNFESTNYPTYELKREQLDKVETLMEKLRIMRDEIL